MIALTVALVVAALVCLLFDATKLIGVVIGVAGIALLFCLYPLLFLIFPILGGVAGYFYFTRSSNHDVPELPDRRD